MKCLAVASISLHLSLWQVVIAQEQEGIDIGLDNDIFPIFQCFTSCNNGFTGNEVIPGQGCKYYQECWEGELRSRKKCGPPLIFDVEKDWCNFPSQTFCATGSENVECPEGYSYSPTTSSYSPTGSGVETPVVVQTPNSPPVQQPVQQPGPVQQPDQPMSETPTIQSKTDAPTKGFGNAISHVESKRYLIEKYVLISYNSATSGLAHPSISYTFDKFMQSLQVMGVDGFGADFKFELWEGNGNKYHYGLVNLAAFLSNCMVESIEADTCDELNWQQTSGRHAISNSCGQESRSYQDETCDVDDDIFSCDVVPEIEITAASVALKELAAPPLQCKPGSGEGQHSGYWDASSGTLLTAPYSNDLGRTDTEGCCFWGRGALLTRGVCNHGKVNYYLGKRGADLGKSTLYPTVDFCEYPEATCVSIYSEELRWSIAFFEWAERVQRYYKNGSNGWDYEEKLTEFVDNGMVDDSFINSVSRILSRGCHASGCSDLEVRMLDKRRSNFYLIINDIFDIKTLLDPPDPTRQPTTLQPTRKPTPRPTSTTVDNFSPPASSPSPQIIPMPTTPNPIESQNINPSPTEPFSANADSGQETPKPTRTPQGGNASPSNLIGLEGNGVIFCRNHEVSISLIISTAAYYLLQ